MKAGLTAALLLVAVAGIVLPRLRRFDWVAPIVCAGVALAAGLVAPAHAEAAVRPLWAPLAFVVFAVPMAVLLDRFGLFRALAELVTGGRSVLGGLWILAAVVTATLNLDAAVVLLAPLYLRIAHRLGLSPLLLALQPALLSGLASSALPISNVTNLIATGQAHLTLGAFVVHLALPTVMTSVVGWFAYRACRARIERLDPSPQRAPEEDRGRLGRSERRRTIAVGGAIAVVLVAGFLAAPSFGGAPWEVAAAGDLVLVVMTRSLPLRAIPWQSVGIVLGLGVLARAATAGVDVRGLLGGAGPGAISGAVGVSAAASNLVNNLPAVLVALPAIGPHASWTLWAVLLGTNVGPLAVPSGSLAVLLWLATVRRLGLEVADRHVLAIGWRIALPSLVAGLVALLGLRLALGAGG